MNSSLSSYTKLSPNHSGKRNHSIDTFTPHCVAGQLSVESLGNVFASSARQASSNYGIGSDGKIGVYVNEENRSWCTSSSENDHRAVTVEVASDNKHPYAFTTAAYDALIKLCVDVCKRNGKTQLVYLGDNKNNTNYQPKANEMRITLHRWYATKACPGQWLVDRLPQFVASVNEELGAETSTNITTKPTTNSPTIAKSESIRGTYLVNAKDGLWLRKGAENDQEKVCIMQYGKKVQNYGYYSGDWYYVQYGNKVGFCHKSYLKKV